MQAKKWNHGWKFWPDRDTFALSWDIPGTAKDVTLPHDAMMEEAVDENSPNGGNTGFRNGASYTYVKLFAAPEEWRNQTVKVAFEGVYMNAMVFLNGQFIAKNPFGYSSFYAKLDGLLKYGEVNELRVQARSGAMTNSRWYSGSGIYRDVYLLVGGPVHIIPEGVQISTEAVDDIEGSRASLAVLRVSSELKNREMYNREIILQTDILDREGKRVASDAVSVVLFEAETRTMTQRIAVSDVWLWSDREPNLYTVRSVIKCVKSGEVIDAAESVFGVRTLSLDSRHGLRVNGQETLLRGACIHHDSGLLGAATYEEAQFRQIKLLKEAGFNAVRMSHHPMAPAMLRACDTYGVFVMDELSDMWNRTKSDYDYGLYFEEWWRNDVTAMVRKDFNHPSVIFYSIGNEIPEIGTDAGAKTAHEISSLFSQLDRTRYTTAGINGLFAASDRVSEILADISAQMQENGEISGNVNDFMSIMNEKMDQIVAHSAISERLEKACANLDVAGYNYMSARYEKDGTDYPNRVIVGSETYPSEIAGNWKKVKENPHVIGDFTWTGWDYIGEAGIGIPGYQPGEGGTGALFPAQLAYCGDIDITGFRRPASYLREIVFGLRKEPYIAVQNPCHYGKTVIKTPWVISDTVSSWNYPGWEGKPAIVEVYSPGDEVELIVNGHNYGKHPAGESADYRTLFETVYMPGEVEAISYENGSEISRTKLISSGDAVSLRIEKEEREKDGELTFFHFWLTDAKGNPVKDQTVELTVSYEGEAEIFLGSGNPKPVYDYRECRTRTWDGHAQMIVRKLSETNVKIAISTDLDLRYERWIEI